MSIDKATGTVERRFLLDSLSGWPNFNRCPTKWIWHFLAFLVCGELLHIGLDLRHQIYTFTIARRPASFGLV
nr:hypothetical protein CFP56_55429 [Quercus suber]